jgi:recombination protein RecA
VAKKKKEGPSDIDQEAKKAREPKASTLANIAHSINERCGSGTIVTGRELTIDPPRLPTGIFAVDFAIGGGVPIHATTCLWGPESGGKSNLSINAMAMVPKICWSCYRILKECKCSTNPLRLRSAWLDVEGTFDRDWAERIGANPEDYVLCLGEYGEQYSNIADDVLRADDCGLVVIDSLAALVPADEMDSAAEDQFYALQARLIGRMVRKIKQRLIRERKREHPCTVIFINQMRTKVGKVFGDPETMPGGHGMKHEFSLLLRCVKKTMKSGDGPDAKYKDDKRQKKLGERFSFSIRKAKVQTLAGVGEYVRLLEDIPAFDLKKGQVDDYTTLLNYAKQFGIVSKDGTSWKYFDRKASRQEDIKNLLIKNISQKVRTQQEIVSRAKAQFSGTEVSVDETDAPEEVD